MSRILCILSAFSATALVISFWLILGVHYPDLYNLSTNESVFAELFTAIFYLAAGLLLAWSYIDAQQPFLKKLFPLLLAFFFIFIAGEEESWGMWIFGFSAPAEISSVNLQNETNIHNLDIFSGLFNPHRILNLFVFGFCLVAPILFNTHLRFRRLLQWLSIPVVPLPLAIWFAGAIGYERMAPKFMNSQYIENWRHAEVTEFLFSIGFLVFVVLHIYKKKQSILK